MSLKSISGSGRPLNGQAREIVYNVSQYFKNLKTTFVLHYISVINMTSEATGISITTVKRIMTEGKESSAKGHLRFHTPENKKNRRKKNIMEAVVGEHDSGFDNSCSAIIRRKRKKQKEIDKNDSYNTHSNESRFPAGIISDAVDNYKNGSDSDNKGGFFQVMEIEENIEDDYNMGTPEIEDPLNINDMSFHETNNSPILQASKVSHVQLCETEHETHVHDSESIVDTEHSCSNIDVPSTLSILKEPAGSRKNPRMDIATNVDNISSTSSKVNCGMKEEKEEKHKINEDENKDKDKVFLLSLLPAMKELTDVQKNKFKTIVLNELMRLSSNKIVTTSESYSTSNSVTTVTHTPAIPQNKILLLPFQIPLQNLGLMNFSQVMPGQPRKVADNVKLNISMPTNFIHQPTNLPRTLATIIPENVLLTRQAEGTRSGIVISQSVTQPIVSEQIVSKPMNVRVQPFDLDKVPQKKPSSSPKMKDNLGGKNLFKFKTELIPVSDPKSSNSVAGGDIVQTENTENCCDTEQLESAMSADDIKFEQIEIKLEPSIKEEPLDYNNDIT